MIRFCLFVLSRHLSKIAGRFRRQPPPEPPRCEFESGWQLVCCKTCGGPFALLGELQELRERVEKLEEAQGECDVS
jgi:hypothetical protein